MDNNTGYFTWVWELRDKRVDDWPLTSSPLPTVFFSMTYVLFALKLGPLCMKDKTAFKIRKLLVFFNIFMLCYNGYLLHQFWILGYGDDYDWICQPVDRSMNPRSLKMATAVWLYFICKFIDCLDTVFFLLRKKFDHISGLHVYHHSVMPCFAWVAIRFAPGGHTTFGGILNTGVHVIMHFYYCIAALGPNYQKYLWWKKYVTILQLAQFVTILLHEIRATLSYNCDFGIPSEWIYFYLFQCVLFFCLFLNFYLKTYKSIPDSICALQKSNNINNY